MKSEKIQYNTHVFKYYDRNGLVCEKPGRECSSKESAESVADERVTRIEKVNLETGEVISWGRDEFTYGKIINNKKV